MPIGILNINPYFVKNLPKANQLKKLIDAYFKTVNIETNETNRTRKPKTENSQSAQNPVDPPTITGLAIFLGFDSLAQLEEYESKKYFGPHLRRARLLIAAAYEKKLHNTYTSGPIFALKCMMGWGDKQENKPQGENLSTFNVIVQHTGPELAENEKLIDV